MSVTQNVKNSTNRPPRHWPHNNTCTCGSPEVIQTPSGHLEQGQRQQNEGRPDRFGADEATPSGSRRPRMIPIFHDQRQNVHIHSSFRLLPPLQSNINRLSNVLARHQPTIIFILNTSIILIIHSVLWQMLMKILTIFIRILLNIKIIYLIISTDFINF